jgi:hypothetical protein
MQIPPLYVGIRICDSPPDADHKQQLCLRADIESTLQTGLTLKLHQLLLLVQAST